MSNVERLRTKPSARRPTVEEEIEGQMESRTERGFSREH